MTEAVFGRTVGSSETVGRLDAGSWLPLDSPLGVVVPESAVMVGATVAVRLAVLSGGADVLVQPPTIKAEPDRTAMIEHFFMLGIAASLWAWGSHCDMPPS